jgi:hypothetical protein
MKSAIRFYNGGLTSQRRQLEVVHLGQRHDQRELVLVHGKLEQRPPADDLPKERKPCNLKHL